MSMEEIRERHKEAIEQYGHHYIARGTFGLPTFKSGNQSFSLFHDTDDLRYDAEHREWLGIMLCAALKNLVEEHTAAPTPASTCWCGETDPDRRAYCTDKYCGCETSNGAAPDEGDE
ncbi:MAG: hypothetical protein AB3N13_12145 [Arenibacterium sp.]